MVEACEAAGVDLLVFHGRGGSISVGGGRTEGLVRSSPPGAIGGRLRVTEQGESVNERYGLRPIAMRSFERSVNAVALAAAGQPRAGRGGPALARGAGRVRGGEPRARTGRWCTTTRASRTTSRASRPST